MSASLAFEPTVLISRVHLLRQKIQHPADGFGGLSAIVKLFEMALQAGQFLGNIRAVGKEDNFLEQSLIIRGGRWQTDVLDPLDQLLPIALGGLGRLFLKRVRRNAA